MRRATTHPQVWRAGGMYHACPGEVPARRLQCDGSQAAAGLDSLAVGVVGSAAAVVGTAVEAGPGRDQVGYRPTRRS